MMHLVNVFVKELSVKQPVNVVKAYFLKPIVSAKFENERRKARNDSCVVRHVIFHDFVNQKEHELREYNSNNKLIYKTVENDLECKK